MQKRQANRISSIDGSVAVIGAPGIDVQVHCGKEGTNRADTCIFGRAWATATETVEQREAPLRVQPGGSIASPSIISPQSIFAIPHGLQKRDGFPWRC
jgi:hypothetical protein